MIQFNYTFDPETRTLTPSGDPVNVKGDTNVVQIIFTMPASYEGLALSTYVWRVFYKIAMNTKLEEVRFHQFTNPTTEGENLVLTWTVTNSVTEFAGHLGFALSGTLTDTGGNVTNRINSIPAYERIEPTIGGGSYTEDDAEIEGIKDFLVGIQEAAEAAQEAAETAAAEAEASAARAEQIADELEPYKSLAIVESASGNPATFTDGSNGVPMKSVSVDIDPVQDLHGYEYPWVGGAGKNLFNLDVQTFPVVGKGITITEDDGVLNLNGTVSESEFVFPFTSEGSSNPDQTFYKDLKPSTAYTFTTGYSQNISLQAFYKETGTSSWASLASSNNTGILQFTTPSSYALIWIRFRFGLNTTLSNVKIYPMIRLSTVSDATFAPYTNICPISGWDEVKVTRTGKNLFDEVYPNISSTPQILHVYVGKGATVTLSTTAPKNSSNSADLFLLKNMVTSSGATTNNNGVWSGQTRTVTSTDGYVTICYRMLSDVDPNDYDTMLEFGSTATEYEPFVASTTYTISLTSAGTVYGGTLDAVTGELVVDRKIETPPSSSWTLNGTPAELLEAVYTASDKKVGTDNLICSRLKVNGARAEAYSMRGRASSKVISFCLPSAVASDLTSLRAWVDANPLQICYELDTPLTYTLTPTQITSLLGTNHVWADCGEVAVEYVADTKMYIDKIVASL